jgi:acyl-CoA thioesterase I
MKIICHGDSLTEGADLEKAFTWPSLLENNLQVSVVNHGIGGDTTAGMLSRFSFEVLQQRPSLVIIMGGTNDLWWDLDVNIIQANLSSMVCQARHYDITPIMALPLPFWREKAEKQDWEPPARGYDHFGARLHELVKILTISSDQWETPLLDFHSLFLNDQGNVKTEFFLEDGLHANRAGHLCMSKHANQLLNDVFNFA